MRNDPVRRLNWGCGRHRRPGWINSDRRELSGVDVASDIREGLPLERDSIDYAVSIHALQELGYHELVPALQELRRVLKRGGVLRLVLPDLLKAVDAFRRGESDYFQVPDAEAKKLGSKLAIYLVWYGHTRTVFTAELIEELLSKAGFTAVAHCSFQRTSSAWPDIVELDSRERESLYIEATK